MYATRNGKKNLALRDKSNLPATVMECRIVFQKIPLVEVNKTLRPRRGCKENALSNNCKENQLPHNNPDHLQKSCKNLKSALSENYQNSEKNLSSEKTKINILQSSDSKKSDFSVDTKNKKALQKIPLVEPTKTLRPRRGCKQNVGVADSKEKTLHPSDSVPKTTLDTKNVKALVTSVSENVKPSEVIEISAKIIKDSNKRKFQSNPTHNFASKKSCLIYNTKTGIKRPMISTNENENPAKRTKSSKSKISQENTMLSRFPKWISNGIESLKRGSKRARISVYDLDKDEVLMLEKPMSKEVVKKAKVIKTKKYVTKNNVKNQRNKNCVTKTVPKKLTDNCSSKCLIKPTAEGAKIGNTPLKQNIEENCVPLDDNLKEREVKNFEMANPLPEMANTLLQNKEFVPSKAFSTSDKQKSCISDLIDVFNTTEIPNVLCGNPAVDNSFEVHETPEKQGHYMQTNFPYPDKVNCQFKNLRSFPMPQLASTPENIDRPMITAQVSGNFEATMFEIPRVVPRPAEVEFDDGEFLLSVNDHSVQVQLFESPVSKATKNSQKEKAVKKPSAVKNLNAALKTHNSNHLLKAGQQHQEKSVGDNDVNPSNVEQALAANTDEAPSNKVAKKTTNSKHVCPHKDPEPAVSRSKRTCQLNKPAIRDSSDLDSSSESELDQHEVTLFESPEKKRSATDAPKNYSPSKMALMKLFPYEFDQPPAKVIDVEEKVLKPRLSYHSPAQVRRYVSKVKKASKVTQRVKTKQDKLIDSLNQHFSELDDLELCIE